MRPPSGARRSAGRRCRCARSNCRCSATRRASACSRSASARSGGESAAGEPGFVHIVDCRTGAEGTADERRGRLVERTRMRRRTGRAGRSAGSSPPIVGRACGWSRRPPLPGLQASAPPSIDVDPQQPPFLRVPVVRLRGDRAGDLRAGGAKETEGSEAVMMISPSWPMACASQPTNAGAETVAVGLYARGGSRDEPDHLTGLAHCSSIWCSRARAAATARAYRSDRGCRRDAQRVDRARPTCYTAAAMAERCAAGRSSSSRTCLRAASHRGALGARKR